MGQASSRCISYPQKYVHPYTSPRFTDIISRPRTTILPAYVCRPLLVLTQGIELFGCVRTTWYTRNVSRSPDRVYDS